MAADAPVARRGRGGRADAARRAARPAAVRRVGAPLCARRIGASPSVAPRGRAAAGGDDAGAGGGEAARAGVAAGECHEEGPGGGTNFWDFLKLPGHTKLILWPEIRATAAERA
eukprot:363746-Chlamydomonas_euryale.AAC.2